MLRDPVERVLSYYWFVLSTPEHYAHARFKELGSLGAAIERSGNHELDNFQVRLLDGQATLLRPRVKLDPSSLDRAKEHLGKFRVVGLTEKFEESLALLAAAFGWRDLAYHRFKQARQRPRPSDLLWKELELVRNANALDIELYEFGRTLFDARCRAAGAEFESALLRVRRDQILREAGDEIPPPEPSLRGGIWRL